MASWVHLALNLVSLMCQNDSIDHICGYNDSQKAQMDPLEKCMEKKLNAPKKTVGVLGFT